jgi:hypothetical protein
VRDALLCRLHRIDCDAPWRDVVGSGGFFFHVGTSAVKPALLGGAGGICGMVVVFAGLGGGGGGVFFGGRRGGREVGVVAAEGEWVE